MADKTLYIVRHAESIANAGGKTDSPSAIALSDHGKQQAIDLVPHLTPLNIRAVIVSPYPRTLLTAKPFLATRPDLSPYIWQIQEFTFLDEDKCRGTTQLERTASRQTFWDKGDPEFRDGPKSERFVDVVARANSFLKNVLLVPNRTAIFTHGQFWMICTARLHAPTASAAELMRTTYSMQYEQKRNLRNAQILPLAINFGKIVPPAFPGVESPEA